MRKPLLPKSIWYGFLLLSFLMAPEKILSQESEDRDIRPSILAGTWYPAKATILTRTIQRFLSQAEIQPVEGALKALIVPHAGYRYSGHVAAHAYRLLQNSPFTRAILIGPSHRAAFRGVSVNPQSGYETPLGVVPVDQELARRILDTGTGFRWLKRVHAGEHSLEIQIPFLQTVLPRIRIVPIIMGQQNFDTCLKLAETLVKVLENDQDTLLLASTDLSHYHPYDQARALDARFVEYIKDFDPHGLGKALAQKKCEACGGGPTIATLLASRQLGARRTMILKYANSGDVTGDHSAVVGYVSAAVMK